MKNLLIISLMSFFATWDPVQTTLSVSTTITQIDVGDYAWPVVITGGDASDHVVITLAEDIMLSDVDQYFIIQSEYVEFDGNNNNVIINMVPDYRGLVQNGTGSDAYSYITVKNTKILSGSSSLAGGAGWIGQYSFGANATDVIISKCSSDGNISVNGGGIAGENSFCTITKSH